MQRPDFLLVILDASRADAACGAALLYCTAAQKVTYLHRKKCYFLAPLRISQRAGSRGDNGYLV